MYLEMTEEEDKKVAESWKADAEGILVFVRLHLLVPFFKPIHESQTGLFSAAVASLISVSIQDIQQNPQVPPTSTLQISINFLPKQINRMF